MGKIRSNEPIVFWFNNKPIVLWHSRKKGKKHADEPTVFWFDRITKKKVVLLLVVLTVAIGSVAFWIFCRNNISTKYAYNKGTVGIVATQEPFDVFQEKWSQEEALAILPESFPEEMDVIVYPRFTADGCFYDIEMEVTSADSKRKIYIESNTSNEVICKDPVPKTTSCGKVTYTLCRGPMMFSYDNSKIVLGATATITEVEWFFYVIGTRGEEHKMKEDFEALLDCFGDDPITWESVNKLIPNGSETAIGQFAELSRALG